ncbi:MAG: NADH-quinone oxidoreductase subunit NuoI [Bacteroidia bacterium]|nr:NADH-quinone oxidoreductase subunit NuoI [Bacteroidia bacterium]MDW8333428.1 NADH-quinone oxidoreductase subunit NuoI [Bacteroidia bacterium]
MVKVNYGKKDERKLNFVHKLYFPEIFKGLWFTFKHIFRPSVTIEYPEYRPQLGPEFRGRPVLVAENGKERCVACGLCARVCPPLAISMQAAETDDAKERYPERFEIDMLRCIYCGLCEEVCPEEAIVMSEEYDFVFHNRKDAIFDKSKLMIEKNRLRKRLDWLNVFRNPNFGEVYDFQKQNNIHSVRDRASA